MGWWRSWLGLTDGVLEHVAPVEPSATFSVDLTTPVDDAIRLANAPVSNTPVSRDAALSVPAVLRGRNLLVGNTATLPLITRDRHQDVVAAPLLEQIDPDVANLVVLAQTVDDLLFEAISWWRITARNAAGWPTSAVHCDVDTVSLEPPGHRWREARTLPSGQQLPGGVVWVNGEQVPGRDMVRFDSPNPPLRIAAARVIRRALLLEEVSAMYAANPRAQDYFAPVDNADPATDDEVRDLLAAWEEARRNRVTGYVPSSLTYHTVDAPSPADLQLVELQRKATLDLANAMGLDAEDLQVSTTSRTYANATDRRRDRINDTLAPFMQAITARLSMNDITRRGQRVEFDLDDFLRADPLTRWQTYEIAHRMEAISTQEIRTEERMPAVPVEPRPVRRVPTPQPQEVPGMAGSRTPTASRVADLVRFSDDGTQTIAFDIPAVDAEFKVDRQTRTVSGLLVPWNRVARSGFAKWSFNPNSLTWTDASRVKLNREHDRRTAVAYATSLENTSAGLIGAFKVARGAAGDEVLSLAEDRVLDGFSIEVDFDADGSGWTRDPDDDLVRQVHTGYLKGCAITSAPAFDDARVTSVAASRNDGRTPTMTGTTGTEQQTPAAAPGTDTTAAFTTAVEAFTEQTGNFADAVARLVEAQQTNGEGPQVVDPTRRTAAFTVNEEPVYRFGAPGGKHDFSTDIIAGAKGDGDALHRAQTWIAAHFAAPNAADFAVNQAGIAGLNPAIQRPDLYVDQLQYPTPIWDAIRKGTIDGNTPFVLPKFATGTGLVNNHTEGVEPTPGAFTTTTQTITPSAVSGKVEVTREAWDQGGNPQLSTILWRQMVRAYNESLEQAAADLLEGLTLTTITLTAGAVDTALAQEIKSALAALHFARGGFRFRDFKLERGLYTGLAAAKDGEGRPLFPVLGASNADGSMGQYFGAISIAGLAGEPAWALPFVNGAPNDSYLFNREDVHGWASNPQRLDFQYRVAFVDVAVWGYKALACTRTDGVRKITYDNAA